MELPSHPLHASREQCGRGVVADLSNHSLQRSRISAATRTLPQASMAGTGTTTAYSSDAAHLTHSNVLVQSRRFVFRNKRILLIYEICFGEGRQERDYSLNFTSTVGNTCSAESQTLAFNELHCIIGSANRTASCNNVRLHAGTHTYILSVSQWTIFKTRFVPLQN
jgi:hypothetical protein